MERTAGATPSCGCATSRSSNDAAAGAFSNHDGRRGISRSGCSTPDAVNGRGDTRMSCPDRRLGPTPVATDIVTSVFVELSVVCVRRRRADPTLLGATPLAPAAIGAMSTAADGKIDAAAGLRRIWSCAILCTAAGDSTCVRRELPVSSGADTTACADGNAPLGSTPYITSAHVSSARPSGTGGETKRSRKEGGHMAAHGPEFSPPHTCCNRWISSCRPPVNPRCSSSCLARRVSRSATWPKHARQRLGQPTRQTTRAL